MIKSIVIVRLSALGDVLMLVPLIRTLQAHLPEAKLTWIISRPAYDLVAGMDNVEFIVIEKPNNLKDFWRFRQLMKARQFDVLLAPQASLRTNLLYPLIRAKRKIGYDDHRAKDGHRWFVKEQIKAGREHTLEGFLKFAEPLGIQDKVLRWDLAISAADREWARAHLPTSKPILVINPAASKAERSWLVARYVEVAQQAMARWDVQLVLTGGPGAFDRQLASQILTAIPQAIDLVGKTKPKQLLAVLAQATVVVCPDTGPSHMAVAVNTPVVALQAVTNAYVSGPYTFLHYAVNCYPQAVESILHVSYEQHHWGQHVHGSEAMALISVDAVLEKLALIL